MPDACDEWRPIPGGPVSVVIPPPLLPPRRGAALACPAPRPPAPSPPSRPGRHPPLPLEVRLDALGAVVLDGLSYRRAARMVGICKTEVGDSLDLLLGELAALGLCQPDGTFVATLQNLRERLAEMTEVGEAVCVDGLAARVQRPAGGPTRRSWMTPSGAPKPPRAWRCRPSTAICCGCDDGWPGSCHEHELLEVSGVRAVLDATGVTALVDRGFRGMAKAGARGRHRLGHGRGHERVARQQQGPEQDRQHGATGSGLAGRTRMRYVR